MPSSISSTVFRIHSILFGEDNRPQPTVKKSTSIALFARGSLDIPFVSPNVSGVTEKPYLKHHYIAFLYLQVFCNVTNLNYHVITKKQIRTTQWNIVYYDGESTPIFGSDSMQDRENAIDLFLAYQVSVTEIPEASIMGVAYEAATTETARLKAKFQNIVVEAEKRTKKNDV